MKKMAYSITLFLSPLFLLGCYDSYHKFYPNAETIAQLERNQLDQLIANVDFSNLEL